MKNTTLCGKILHFVVNYIFCGTMSHFLWYNITFLWYNITFCSTFVVYLWYICDVYVVFFFAMGDYKQCLTPHTTENFRFKCITEDYTSKVIDHF